MYLIVVDLKRAQKSMLTDTEYNNLFKYGVALSGNEDDAWELLQQAVENYIRVCTSKMRTDDNHNPSAYVRRSIKNLFIDRMRHQQKFHHIEYEESALDPVFIHEDQSLEDMLITKQEYEACWELMDIEERELIYLAAVEGYTIQEIADDLGFKKGTLLSKIHRLKVRLRTQLEHFCQDKRIV